MKKFMFAMMIVVFSCLAMSFAEPIGKTCAHGRGELEWKATAIKKYKTCVSCKGKGSYQMNGKWYTCTLCKGTGKTVEYEPGYECKNCHKVFR